MHEQNHDSTLDIYKAGGIGNKKAKSLRINIETELTDEVADRCSLSELGDFYRTQGIAVADALLESLPGGTVDAMIGQLLARRASLFRAPLFEKEGNPNA